MLQKLCLRFVSAFFVFDVICVRLLICNKAPVSKGFECLGLSACRIRGEYGWVPAVPGYSFIPDKLADSLSNAGM